MGPIETHNGIKTENVTKNLFEFKYIIGRGGFGKVWKVSYKKTQHLYALKEMSKVKIIDRKSEKSIMSERNLLSKLHHPFLVNMIYTFQDQDYLYLVMDLLKGGDMRYHLCRYGKFSEQQTKFFMGCLILALEYIHQNQVIHRDLKPENLVCDDKGYIRLTDFGVAKKVHKNNGDETSGTPGYMSPEVLCGQNHSFPVDYFALGVIGYEFMLGERPYLGKNRKEIKQAVLARQIQIRGHEIPIGWSIEACDLINKLIQRKVSHRIGKNGIEEIKNHMWFNEFNWKQLYDKKMLSPFKPKAGDNFDRKYCEMVEKIGNDTNDRYRKYQSRDNYKIAFLNYTCNNIPTEEYKKLANQLCFNSNNPSINTTSISTINKRNNRKKSYHPVGKFGSTSSKNNNISMNLLDRISIQMNKTHKIGNNKIKLRKKGNIRFSQKSSLKKFKEERRLPVIHIISWKLKHSASSQSIYNSSSPRNKTNCFRKMNIRKVKNLPFFSPKSSLANLFALKHFSPKNNKNAHSQEKLTSFKGNSTRSLIRSNSTYQLGK